MGKYKISDGDLVFQTNHLSSQVFIKKGEKALKGYLITI